MVIIFVMLIILCICYVFRVKKSIPNIIHFVFGLKPQENEFMFVYYLSILSAYIVNKPEKIYFYYHYKPYGKWWDRLSEQIPIISFEKVELPDKIGSKNIKHYAHKADWIRMNKLYERGGVYMDIDTITCKPYHKYRSYSTVLGYEIKSKDLICNAVMMTIPESPFFKLWLERYEEEFKEDGWGEASIRLPGKINKNYPYLANVLSENTFFRPYATEGEKIFSENITINDDLITLHLWESYTMKYMEDIKDFEWIKQNKETLYSKIVLSNISESDI